jgi:hypothetical protein
MGVIESTMVTLLNASGEYNKPFEHNCDVTLVAAMLWTSL